MSLSKTIFYFILISFALIVVKWKLEKNRYINSVDNYNNQNIGLYRQKYLLTKAEYEFWKILNLKCKDKDIIICPKVRMEDFLYVDSRDFRVRQKHRGYIKARHIDFILCDKNLNIIAGIELDDKSHYKQTATNSDELKNNIFNQIGISLFRVPVKSFYYDSEIEKILLQIHSS